MATARQFTITDAEVVSSGGAAAYATLDVPDDYIATLTAVEDYSKEKEGKTSEGWEMTFEIEGLRFLYWVPFSDAARWKFIDTANAFDPTFIDQRDASGVTPVFDPDQFIGHRVAARVDWEKDRDTKERQVGGRKVIDYIYELVEDASDVPTL